MLNRSGTRVSDKVHLDEIAVSLAGDFGERYRERDAVHTGRGCWYASLPMHYRAVISAANFPTHLL